ncbi:MAG: WYL domain-containing protein [Bacteroidales bacterium]|nr:WYL domain-containing protein [Bacteroidales bacterium]
MANAYHLKRLSLLVGKLSGKYVPQEELLRHVESQVAASFPSSTGYSLRTLQRDFKTLRESFGIDVRFRDGYGYYLVEGAPDTEGYKSMLQNFELLSSIYSDSVMQKFVIPEHRRITVDVELGDIFTALRENRCLSFEYVYFRYGNSVASKEIHPYCLKESQRRWYIVGKDCKDGVMKCFALDRMRSAEVHDGKFVRDENLDVPALFRESYGIWNDMNDPVEEVILHYDALDGAFVKTLPLHETQEVLEDSPENGLTIRLRLRITNDFVMELLSRSRSLEVVSPQHLRERVRGIYESALKRNK